MSEPVRVFVAGCGYVGERIAKAEQRLGSKVSGVVRRPDRAATLKGRGLSVMRMIWINHNLILIYQLPERWCIT